MFFFLQHSAVGLLWYWSRRCREEVLPQKPRCLRLCVERAMNLPQRPLILANSTAVEVLPSQVVHGCTDFKKLLL